MSIDYASSLKALKLYGMATAWSELQAEKPRQAHRPETWIERLAYSRANRPQAQKSTPSTQGSTLPHAS